MCPDGKKSKHDDDAALFRRAAGKVRRMESDRVHHPRKRPRPEPVETSAGASPDMDMISAGAPPEAAGPIFHARPGVQQKTLRRLRRGLIAIEDELDLHGMRVAEAGDALAEFLGGCSRRGIRCVRIIHGKGLRAGGSVLKQNVARWLTLREEVLAFCSAQPRDGGTGAVYALLKR